MDFYGVQGHHVLKAIVALLGFSLLVFFVKLYRIRSKMMGLPGPPYHPIFGHIPVAIKMAQSLPQDVHPHHFWYWLRNEYNLGSFFYFDVWPMGPPTLIICDAEIADQVTVKNSLDKHPMVKEYLKQHLGLDNMAAANGTVWRKARTVYNPGFAMSHLMTVIASIVDDMETFNEILGEHADNDQPLELEAVAMKLSFDVIGRLVLDTSLNSQRTSDELVDAFRRQLQYLSSANTWSSPFVGLNPIRNRAIAKNSAVIDKCLGAILDSRYAASAEKQTKRKRSMLDVAFKTYNDEYKLDNSAGMDASFRQMTIDQIRTFVFAGHDTISTTIAMLFYFLHHNPSVRDSLIAELNAVFPATSSNPSTSAATAAKIRADPYVLNALPYTTATIKETLRLFPPANTVRVGTPDSFITDPATNTQYPTHDWVVWPDSYVIGRDEQYYPEPLRFAPERWLPASEASRVQSDGSPWPIPPAGAFRAFERGPRNCIGAEFGMLEVKVVAAMCVREYEFVPGFKEGDACVDGEPCYQMLFGSAKPKGSVPGKMVRVKKG
ncbi:cytochrome P450 [Microthyrium microscopicum]|uniref:Cytochrome P450 n=1 Tax=Microthyrium microscopicum TaxID=703497 RepID=A0A6A6TW86_9PEZI|nr:cytochrome P450 [Microthyrium microscopicum]